MAFSDGVADFRSDTVTRPTPEMREAMANAVVGDDVYGEDPTVNELQERCAEIVGHEAALYLPSGTMGNQIGIALNTHPGAGLVCVERSHVRLYEAGGAAANSGVQILPVASADGTITPEQIFAVGDGDPHLPAPMLLSWENTHNVSGGTVVGVEMFARSSEAARERGWKIHLDGARVFNAAVAADVAVTEFTRHADTVQFCLSKGLGAPVGSIIAGSTSLMERALAIRKRFGGGMRQAGIIAAGALVALDQRHHLRADHELARRLAKEIGSRLPSAVANNPPATNIVLVDGDALPGGAKAFISTLENHQVKLAVIYGSMLRFVTHRDVNESDVDRVVGALDDTLEKS